MVTGLSGVQFGLYSYERVTKSDDRLITLSKVMKKGSFFKQKLKKIQGFFASFKKSHLSESVRWRVLSNYLGMTHTVLLNCRIKAEIWTVDSQTDLRILL